jgi:hypothetical protein
VLGRRQTARLRPSTPLKNLPSPTGFNDSRRRLFGRSGRPIAFVCEQAGCTSTIVLTCEEFDALRAVVGAGVRCPDHGLPPPKASTTLSPAGEPGQSSSTTSAPADRAT